MKSIGVIGLGIVGSIWARHYLADGVLVGVWNRTPQPDSPKWKASPEAVAGEADVIQIVVADPPAVRGVLERILPVLGPGKTVIQSSTIDPVSSDEFRRRVLATGARYLEAPFTGSRPFAEQRQTVFYVGGDPADLAAAEPHLALISAVRLPIGTNTQACALKLAMNLNLAAQMQALAEALTFSRRAGISDETFFGAMARNAGQSGLTKLKEPKLRANDFTPQFSVKHMLKDVRLATEAAGKPLPLLGAVKACLEATASAGHVDEDYSVVIRMLSESLPTNSI